MIVISRWAISRSLISLPTSSGRLRAARSGSTKAVFESWISLTVVMNSPCTNRASLVSITTTDCFGAACALACGRRHQQERHHHRQNIDQRYEIELRIDAITLMVLRHAQGTVRHAHECAPLGGAALGGPAPEAGAAAGTEAASGAGASPMEISGNSSACTVFAPLPVSNTRTRSMTCTSVSYGVSGSSRMLASVLSGNFDLTNFRYSVSPS